MVYDLSRGFWERWILLDFPYYFADKYLFDKTLEKDRVNWKIKDDDILNKITTQEELSGLLNKFLDGLDRLILNNKFSTTIGSEEIKNTWIRRANSFISFCMDKLEGDFETHLSKKELRQEYNKYCKYHKVSGKSDKMIKTVLQEMFGVSEDRINQTTKLGDYNYEWCWTGIKWKKGDSQ
jgi:putative DNA primase/helicase